MTILQSSANAMQIQNAIYLPFLNAQNFRHCSFWKTKNISSQLQLEITQHAEILCSKPGQKLKSGDLKHSKLFYRFSDARIVKDS